MKQEIQDIAIEAAKASPGIAVSAFTLNNAVAIATLVFVILQCVYLMRKWIREESEWGIRLKRWAEGKLTEPGELK
jgi:hypothetical protein